MSAMTTPDYHGAYQQFLEKVAGAADRAVWRTPRHQTYGMDYTAEQVADYRRRDAISVGRSLTLLLDAEGLEIVEKS